MSYLLFDISFSSMLGIRFQISMITSKITIGALKLKFFFEVKEMYTKMKRYPTDRKSTLYI